MQKSYYDKLKILQIHSVMDYSELEGKVRIRSLPPKKKICYLCNRETDSKPERRFVLAACGKDEIPFSVNKRICNWCRERYNMSRVKDPPANLYEAKRLIQQTRIAVKSKLRT